MQNKSSMESEIYEQSEIISNLIDCYIKGSDILIEVPDNIKKIVFVASGSSYHCARFAAELFGTIAKMEARAIYSSEFLLKAEVPHETNILYVFITQSGETSDTNKALNRAKELGMVTLAITNKKGSTIWNASDYKIDCHAGEEKSIAATKSLTSQLFCIVIMVLKYAKIKGIDIKPYTKVLNFLPTEINKALKLHDSIKNVAKELSEYNIIVVTADGISYALAKETSLKIKETSYICTLSSILGEFMHGHVAVLNNKSALIHVTLENMTNNAIDNLNKIEVEYKTPIYLIGKNNTNIKFKANLDIMTESIIIKSFCLLVICQLLALEIAQSLGRNIDKPHGLNKIVK